MSHRFLLALRCLYLAYALGNDQWVPLFVSVVYQWTVGSIRSRWLDNIIWNTYLKRVSRCCIAYFLIFVKHSVLKVVQLIVSPLENYALCCYFCISELSMFYMFSGWRYSQRQRGMPVRPRVQLNAVWSLRHRLPWVLQRWHKVSLLQVS